MTGPRASEGAYDTTIQALTGWMSLTGGPDEPPTKSGLSLSDFLGGYVAALAVVAGVWRARREGVGGDADLSLFETALAQLNYMGAWSATGGWQPSRVPGSGHQTLIPFQTFAAADGFIAVACAKEVLWQKYCTAIERPDLARTPDLPISARATEIATRCCRSSMRSWPAAVADLVGRLPRPLGSRSLRSTTWPAPLRDEQAVARGSVIRYEHPTLGRSGWSAARSGRS